MALCLRWGVGERNGTQSAFVPRGISPRMLPLWDTLQSEQLTSPLCAPGALQITGSTLHVHWLFALAFLQEQPNVLWGLPEPSTQPWKLQALSPTGGKTRQNVGPLIPKPVAMGIHFPHVLPYVPVCLLPFCVPVAATISFSPKLPLYLLQCGLFSTFSCGLFCQSPVWFLEFDFLHLRWYGNYLVVVMGEPRVLLLHHHFPLLSCCF